MTHLIDMVKCQKEKEYKREKEKAKFKEKGEGKDDEPYSWLEMIHGSGLSKLMCSSKVLIALETYSMRVS